MLRVLYRAQSAAKGDVVVDAAARGRGVDSQTVGVVDADLPTGPDVHNDDVEDSEDHAVLIQAAKTAT